MKAYIFALFNKILKPRPTSERNLGLFKPDGIIAYDIGSTGLVPSSAPSFMFSLKVSLINNSHYPKKKPPFGDSSSSLNYQ